MELDPWGADTTRSNNAAFQPKKFTSYDRDGNGSDEAMFRRYNRWQSRFDQPDPYDGSYNAIDPQSFNRYAYVHGDPVNFTDPSGLIMAPGGCGAYNENGAWISSPCPITCTRYEACYGGPEGGIGGGFPNDRPHGGSTGAGVGPLAPQNPERHMKDDCHTLADIADELAQKSSTDTGFVRAMTDRLQSTPGTTGPKGYDEFRASGFKVAFQDEHNSYNQVRHFVGGLSGSYDGAIVVRTAAMGDGPPSTVNDVFRAALAIANHGEDSKTESGRADIALNTYSVRAGVDLAFGQMSRSQLGQFIRDNVCESNKK